MLLYGEILKVVGLSPFLAYFEPRKKQLLAQKIEPLNGIGRNFRFSKEKKFLTICEKFGLLCEKSFRVQENEKTRWHVYLAWPIPYLL